MTNGNESAYGYGYCTADGISVQDIKGLTKRELMAKDFMSAILSNPGLCSHVDFDSSHAATVAVNATDILINELNKSKQDAKDQI